MQKSLTASIIIPTLGRPESLKACLRSIESGSRKPEEIILIEEEGPLAHLRNRGLHRARGHIVIFIDDDVEVTREWLAEIHETFQSKDIVGVSGPAIVRPAYRLQRDIFKYAWAKKLYDSLFLEGRAHLPGRITRAGTWTTGACEETCSYEGEVDFLEACNMAYRRDIILKVGGFDERFKGIGDWSEPDLSFRARRFGPLWFNPRAGLYHNCSTAGAFSRRKTRGARLENYLLFSDLWIKPNWRHSLFKLFLHGYYQLKDWRLI